MEGGAPPPRFTLFGRSFSHWSAPVQLCVCVGGVMACFLVTSYAQELVVKSLNFNHSMIVSASIPLVGVIGGAVSNGFRVIRAPVKWNMIVGMLSLVTVGLSNLSLYYLNYPTQIVFKSAKLIPVMIMGVFILHKRYSMADYAAAVMLGAGISIFVLADVAVSPNFDPIGVVIISGALVADAVIGNAQEKVMKEYGSSELEVMTVSSATSLLLWVVLIVAFEHMKDVVSEMSRAPSIVFWVMVYAACNYIGMFFLLAMVERFGAATTAFVTSCRKAISMVVSVLFFPKHVTWGHALGAILVGAGIAVNVMAKQRPRMPAPVQPLKAVAVQQQKG